MKLRSVKRFSLQGLGLSLLLASIACGSSAKLEKCRLIEIEPPETNNLRELISERALIEGWEVEALCGDSLIDFKGSWFKNQGGVTVGDFFDETSSDKGASILGENIALFIDTATSEKKPTIYANIPGNDDFIELKKGDAWNFDK